jgi:D-alanyl-D-alanine dipeptidase
MELVSIKNPQFDVIFDIIYATDSNVTGKALYSKANCFLHKNAAECLLESILLAKEINLKIKIYDAFRPLEAQQALWNKFPNPKFVSNPDNGNTPHCRGIALDITLVDSDNKELDMGTAFDDFTEKSYHGNTDISKKAQENRLTLLDIMTRSNWEHNPNEWWHYQLKNPKNYKKLTDVEAKSDMINY